MDTGLVEKVKGAAVAAVAPMEAQFEIEELFFSRTDGRGVIQAGNSVFQRVSEYEWDKLIGAPHRVIRHPDMPKAVFHLLWSEIQAGRPVGAYVKNRSMSGKHYWVFAVVAPVEGGYLSIRLKPTSPLLPEVERLYAELRQREQIAGVSPAESLASLVEGLKRLGFVDYGSFQARALSHEIAARDAALARMPGACDALRRAAEGLDVVRTEVAAILDAAENIGLTPINMSLQAIQIGERAAAISVISENYRTLSAEMTVGIRNFARMAVEVAETTTHALFLIAAASLQAEMVVSFRMSSAEDAIAGREAEAVRLDALAKAYAGEAWTAMELVALRVGTFAQLFEANRRMIAGLDVTRVMCQMESARIAEKTGSLAEIASNLTSFQNDVRQRLRVIEDRTAALSRATRARRSGAAA